MTSRRRTPLVTLAVMKVLLGYESERRWLRHATAHFKPCFRYLPTQPGYGLALPMRSSA